MNKDICAIQQMRGKGRFVVDQPFTPSELISEITAHITAPTTASVVVLFTVEWALYLKDLGYTNITVSANDPVIENICKKRQLKYVSINELEKNKNMKFDVVVGNPPYQDKVGNENSTSSADLAARFVQLSIQLGALVALVIPSDWVGPNASILKKTLFNCGKLKRLFLYKDKWFAVKKHTCCIIYDSKYQGPCEVTDITGNISEINLATVNCISLNNIETVFLKRFSGNTDSLASRWIHGALYLKNVVNVDYGVEFITAVGRRGDPIQTTTIDISQESTGYGLHKLVIPGIGDNGKIGNIKFASPEQVGGHSVVFLTANSARELPYLKEYLESKFVRYLVLSIKKSTPNSKSVFQNIPNIDTTRSWTDAELYEHFNLTQEEINLIESTVK